MAKPLSVLIRIDAAGETPLLVEDSETLCPGPAVRWRYVCEVEDLEQGRAVVERLKQRPEYWNFDYPREELDRALVFPCRLSFHGYTSLDKRLLIRQGRLRPHECSYRRHIVRDTGIGVCVR